MRALLNKRLACAYAIPKVADETERALQATVTNRAADLYAGLSSVAGTGYFSFPGSWKLGGARFPSPNLEDPF